MKGRFLDSDIWTEARKRTTFVVWNQKKSFGTGWWALSPSMWCGSVWQFSCCWFPLGSLSRLVYVSIGFTVLIESIIRVFSTRTVLMPCWLFPSQEMRKRVIWRRLTFGVSMCWMITGQKTRVMCGISIILWREWMQRPFNWARMAFRKTSIMSLWMICGIIPHLSVISETRLGQGMDAWQQACLFSWATCGCG